MTRIRKKYDQNWICLVSGCLTRAKRGFYRIPEHPLRRREWIKVLKFTKDIKKSTSVCWKHFKKEDFEDEMDPQFVNELGMGRLKQMVVPSILLSGNTGNPVEVGMDFDFTVREESVPTKVKQPVVNTEQTNSDGENSDFEDQSDFNHDMDLDDTDVESKIESNNLSNHPFRCSLCNKGYAQKEYLIKHFKTIHGENLIQFKYSNAKFPERQTLIEHNEQESDEKLIDKSEDEFDMQEYELTVRERSVVTQVEQPIVKTEQRNSDGETMMNSNPWQVDSIQAFNCLKCPECMFFSQEEIDFKDHAMKNHPLSNAFFNEFESNSFIDPAMIKKEPCDTISKDNCDLNFRGINNEYLEENSENVFAENLDIKEEYLKESIDSNDQNDTDYDPLMSLTISADEAYQYYKNTGLSKKGVKGATFGNVKKILEWKNVEIKPRPSDPTLNKRWKSEKDNLVRNFDRILQNMNNKRKGKKSKIRCFFESSKYQTLTYPVLNPEIGNPGIENPDIRNPDIQNPRIENQDIGNSYIGNSDIGNSAEK